MVKGYIYRHWIINEDGIEKSYIGQTRETTAEKRWGKNGCGYKPQKNKESTKFWNGIKKYGWHNFSHKVLFTIECATEEELVFWLNQWEVYYIEKYNSFYNGYNSTMGGEGVITSPATTTAKTIINIIEGSIKNNKEKLKAIKNKIRNFNSEDKTYLIKIMTKYFEENKDFKNYVKRLAKFNIKLKTEDFVYDMFFKQFSFIIYDPIWDSHSHFGVGKDEKVCPYELLFTSTGDVLHIRENGATLGQICRLHSTQFGHDIYAKNTFASKKITTKWH